MFLRLRLPVAVDLVEACLLFKDDLDSGHRVPIDPPFGDQRRSALPFAAYLLLFPHCLTLNKFNYVEYDEDVMR